MGWMIMIVAALLVIGLFAVRSAGWKTVLASSGGNTDELETKCAYLKSNNVKCRIQSEVAEQAGITAQHSLNGGNYSTVKLYVHKKDVERANILLEQFERDARAMQW
ncbi:hypothetical protein [Paenibacillus sp. GCM10012303]|uniref:hypothetical protein n=1 Tax=Paenibacillus sp. GCM10012303 TaxID=3317340 RepID=UPI003612CB26